MILKHRKTKNKKCSRLCTGLTLVEIAIAVTILSLIAGTLFFGFHNLLSRQTLGQINEDVVSFLREAREKTIGREGGFSYGIHVTVSELIRFRAPPPPPAPPPDEKKKTIGREGGFSYGIHVTVSELIRFRAPSYTEGAPENEKYTIPNGFHIASYSLHGGGQNVTFENITGATTQFGDLFLEKQNNSSLQKIIHIYETGAIESE